MLVRRLSFHPYIDINLDDFLERTTEDLCMQLLVLKLLYLLFTTKGTEEYFYTNDLCVLVDVFLRELADLDDDNESVCFSYQLLMLYLNPDLLSPSSAIHISASSIPS